MTPAQLHVLQHSLGVDQYGQGRMYRNHYVGECAECSQLVEMGLMRQYPASELTGGDPLFRVTDEGKAAMLSESPKPPKLTRSQKRYRAYLDSGAYDCGWSFGDWLKRKDAA